MLSATGFVVLALFLLSLLVIGWFTSKLQKTTADYWVAGRSFGVVVLSFGIVASIMHGGTMLGGVGMTAARGAITLNNLSFAAGFFIVVAYLAQKLRHLGAFTLPDFMGERFESNTLRGVSALIILVASVVTVIAQTKTMGIVLSQMTGMPQIYATVLGTTIFVLYTAMGGLMAVVWTNIIQYGFMMIGAVILAVSIFQRLGGLTAVTQAAAAVAPGWNTLGGVGWEPMALISWYVVWFIAYFTRVEFVTKLYSAKDEKTAKLAVPLSLFLLLIFINFVVYFAGAARVLVWDKVANPDMALPVLMSTLLSPLASAFALAGVAAAAMSTTDSLLLISGAAIAHDLVRKSYDEPRGIKRDEQYYVKLSRVVVALVGIVSLVGALRTPGMVLVIVSYAVALTGAAFAMPMVLGLNWQRTSAAGALASTVGGFLGAAIWALFTQMGYPWAKTIHPIIPGFIISLVLIFAVSSVTKPVSEETLQKFFK